jgi:alpha-L-rhamnosidase
MKTWFNFLPVLLLSAIDSIPLLSAGKITPGNLKTEWITNPLGIEMSHPGFSWTLSSSDRGQWQNGYQILVATSLDELARDNGDMWNTGHIISGDQINILYEGPVLLDGARYFWKVRVWDKNDVPSEWSETAWWEMGLPDSSRLNGYWIKPSSQISSPLLRKEFDISKKVKNATAFIFGLGWYELHLNGSKVGDAVLTPANSDYSKRLLYDSYDVTSYLKEGGNAIGVWLADGYGPTYSKYGWRWMGSKCAIVQLNIEFTDGSEMSVVSDESWKASSSPILSADIYNGETYDATKEKPGWDKSGYDDSGWEKAVIASAPQGRLESNMSPPVRAVIMVRSVSGFRRTSSGSYIIDLGQNISGWVRLSIRGAVRGHKIVLRHAEALNDDGTLNTFTNRNAAAADTYICKGGQWIETYEPRFTYHGFRYVEVRGYPVTPDTIKVDGCSVHADVPFTGTFSCSDSLINRIHSNFQWTMLNNMVSIPTDNPVRDERTPCQMDENCIYEAAMNNFDMQQYFKNWLNDIYGNTSNPDWSAGQVLGPWLLYRYYGDRRILENFYPSAKGEVDYCMLNAARLKFWKDSFGDWCPAYSDGTYEHSFSEGEIVNTTLLYKITDLLSQMAGILGNTEDSTLYALKADSVLIAFNTKFLDPLRNVYGSGRQITYIMPLVFGMVPSDRINSVFNNLVNNLAESGYHFGTGIYGTSFLPGILCDHGREDAAFKLFSQTTYPSFGDQIFNYDATTVWEQWGAVKTGREMETYDHAMFAGADKTFITRFGGIQSLTPGNKTISIKPLIPEGLTWVNSSVKTVYGTVTSNWKKSGNNYSTQITIPVNTSAFVYIPGKDPANTFESGNPISNVYEVEFLKTDGKYLVFIVESGNYNFSYTDR